MKKFFILIFALLACTFLAKAQTITDNFESYDAFTVNPTGIWTYYDGDGGTTYNYNAVTVPNLPYVGSCIVMNPSQTNPDITDSQSAHGGSQFLAIYNAVPSTITNGTTTNDWIISPEIPFTNGGELSFWARELTNQYGAETMRILYSTTDNNPSSFMEIQTVNVSNESWSSYSYSIPAGAKYVAFNCVSNDVFALFLDDITISFSTSEPIIMVQTNDIDFGTVSLPSNASTSLSVDCYNLTENLTATVTAPFEVSSNGSSYSSSCTLGTTGGTLFVRYAPTVPGTDNGTITLTSGTASVTVTLTGQAVDCSEVHSISYTCEFDDGAADLNCWEIVDANGDGYSFFFGADMALYSYNVNGTTAANDWLISPAVALGDNARANFNYKVGKYNEASGGAIIPERFGVYVIPEGATYANAIEIVAPHDAYDTVWTTQYVNIAGYSNQTVRIAIRVTSPADMFRIWIDHFVVDSDLPPALTVNPTSMDFSTTVGEPTEAQTAEITGTNLTEDITISATALFEISTDGTNYGSNATVTPTGLNTTATLYVRYNPTTEGNHSGMVLLTSGTLTSTIMLNGTAETVGIDENARHTVNIYPNPASTVLNVEAEGYNTIELMNVVGQVVYSTNITDHMQISVSDLSNGVYFVRLIGDSGTATQKFVKK